MNNIGKANLIHHMNDELEYFRTEDPEHYDEVAQYFAKVQEWMETQDER